ncbi:MAG: 50S ribosomal protein L18e [Candidatus Helarchaeota archaeon]
MIKPLKSANPRKHKLIERLWVTKRRVWRAVARKLDKPKKDSIKVNIFKLNKLTKPKEVIVVPGKVLGDGELDHQITIAAFSFSEKARIKLLEKKVKIQSIEELFESNPKGANVKIIT